MCINDINGTFSESVHAGSWDLRAERSLEMPIDGEVSRISLTRESTWSSVGEYCADPAGALILSAREMEIVL